MNRRRFLEITTVAAAVANLPSASAAWWQGQPQAANTNPENRGLLLYVDPRLGAEAQAYRRNIEAASQQHPLLGILAGGRQILQIQSPTPQQLAYNHVLLVALPDDPLLVQAWQREAAIQPASRSIYAFGFGHLQGPIGYLESDRNPFLHAAAIIKSPYECEWVSLTGTDRAGVGLAVDAFLKQGLVNGLVAAPGWKRTEPTLLDRDPLAPGFVAPAILPETIGSLRRIALTQVAEDEYRGALADGGVMPLSIWQAKYYEKGQWDSAGQIASLYQYATGLHRRAYGNAVWAARFSSAAEAAQAAPRIAAAAKLKPAGSSHWTGDLPRYAWGMPVMGDGDSTGTLELRLDGDSVLLIALARRMT
ncbi:MAG: hypothetical protein PW789_19900 [Edaphobacter sp.]|uniref:hypothetical protein n=1 Tax=Edaphobacter sp. TaxID=1934404 RepID=UPI002397B30B|nr:hypothetical protein [Edaphobacter sp.]MDE1178845.1 hypothetical protein [Edaphobacter sp.]